mgnify:CR=1 FL=1
MRMPDEGQEGTQIRGTERIRTAEGVSGEDEG